MVTTGAIILVVLAILIFFGALHRTLDRMRLSDGAALGIIIAMIAGTFLDFTLIKGPTKVGVNVGGALIPLAVIVWLTATADEASEKGRAIGAAFASGAVIWGLTKILSPDEQFMRISPMIVFGLAAGLIAALAGRSRRAAFVGGVGGMILADVFHWVELAVKRMPGTVAFGGAGTLDATVIAGVIAVGLVELIGETREKVVKTGSPQEEEKQ